MRKVLLAVDGSDNALGAARWIADFCRGHGPIEIHLVNVQPSPEDWQTHGLGRQATEEHLRWRCTQVLESSGAPLREAGLAYGSECAFGDVAEAIVATAERLGCDALVMGRRGLGSIRGMVLGSVSMRVLHQTGLPVVLVR